MNLLWIKVYCPPSLINNGKVYSISQVSERVDDNIDRLNQCLGLWDDVRKINDDIESWTGTSVIELNESLNNLNNSQKISARLTELKVQ